MKTKLQFIALASLAVMGAGCLAVTTGIIANEKEELSINSSRLRNKEPDSLFLVITFTLLSNLDAVGMRIMPNLQFATEF